MDWSGYIFDVVTAFLTGEKLQRELYTRAPKEGLPAVGSCPIGEALRSLEDSQGGLWLDRGAEVVVPKGEELA